MKRMIVLMALLFFAIVGWRIVDGLSSDAIGMGIGVIFGILAGVPMALLVLAASRREERRQPRPAEYGMGYPPYPHHQPPVIVVTGGGAMGQNQGWAQPQPMFQPTSTWDAPRPERRYRIIGAQEEWAEN
jgi:hypothetical protein